MSSSEYRRLALAACLLLGSLTRAAAQSSVELPQGQGDSDAMGLSVLLPDAPPAVEIGIPPGDDQGPANEQAFLMRPGAAMRNPATEEPYHWKALLLQSLAFEGIQNAARVAIANQFERHLLLNKPFWSDYWASLHQYNMRRWNDGDSFKVNYIGHSMEGAMAGYLEIQNDPEYRALRISKSRAYWKSRYRGFLWATVYSTQWEIGPLGEAGIFNQGGFTYSLNCAGDPHDNLPPCYDPKSKTTNNTGWVDFIVTPTVGTLWVIGEDTIDRYVTDDLVERHPDAFKYVVLRAALNPTRSLANLLRGQTPWYRDYEHLEAYQAPNYGRLERTLTEKPTEHVDLNFFSSSLTLQTNRAGCIGCRTRVAGGGAELGYSIGRYLDLVADARVLPAASEISSLNVGGQLVTATFGLRSGYTAGAYSLKATLAPGFASYSRADACGFGASMRECRNYNFAALGSVEGEVRFGRHVAFRAAAEQMVIRYKSADRDPPGIGTVPNLNFLSHDNYINSTNWGVRVGPVLRF